MNKQQQDFPNINGFIEDILNGNGPKILKESFLNPEWHKKSQNIPVNIQEDEHGFYMDVIAPGLSKEEIKLSLSMEDNLLRISYDAPEDKVKEESEPKVLKREYEYRSFDRSFKVGNKVDFDKISAKYESGILKIALPKKETEVLKNKIIPID